MSMWRLVKAERFINLSAMLLQEICTIILRAMVKLMEPTMALEEQDLYISITHAGLNTMPVQQVIFYDGFIDYDGNGIQDPNEGVIVWRGPWGMNGHATKDLNMSSWETAKS